MPNDAKYIQCGFIDDIDKFDNEYFGISMGEAEAMDPTQRIMLQMVHNSIENAGYDIDKFNGTNTSVFVTAEASGYHELADVGSPVLRTGNGIAFLPTKISRALNLTGINSTINTACSSGMVALKAACNGLLLDDFECSIVCGANIVLFPEHEGSIYDTWSSDGKSRAFSENADGMSRGETVVSIILKRLDKAIEDGDNIQAIIKGIEVNNNAARSSSVLATDAITQTNLLIQTWDKAGINPKQLSFIEAHGSGTQLGDALEIEGLTAAFKHYTDEKKICPISTIKSNIGHCLNASSLVGIIKAVECLKNNKFYPTIHSEPKNKLIDFDNTAVYINEEMLYLEEDNSIKYGAVSGMGASGVNGHVVLSSVPAELIKNVKGEGDYLVTISSKTEDGLKRNINNLIAKIEKSPQIQLNNISYTMNFGRKKHSVRAAFTVNSVLELMESLKNYLGHHHSPFIAEDSIYIFCENSGDKKGVCEKLSSKYEIFNQCLIECINIVDERNENFYDFVFQYGLWKVMEACNLAGKNIISIGLGKFVYNAISGKESLESCVKKALDYKRVDIENIEERVKKLISKNASQNIIYVGIGFSNELTKLLIENSNDKMKVTYFNEELSDPILAILHEMFVSGFDISWTNIEKFYDGKRIELPEYSFEKKRCWIRETPKVAPQTDTQLIISSQIEIKEEADEFEKELAILWGKVLGINEISLYDDFFEIGGNSLKATEIITSLNNEYAIELSFEDIFDFSTIRELSHYIKSQIRIIDVIRAIWKITLKTKEDIKDSDNFFKLGGHSLLATQVLIGISHQFGVQLNFEDFFGNPTLKALTGCVENLMNVKRDETSNNEIAPINAKYYDISSAQKRLWVLSQFENGSKAYNTPIVVELSGDVDVDRVDQVLQELVDRHEAFRTIFTTIEGQPKIKILDKVDLEVQHFTEENIEKDIEKFLAPFELNNNILIRAGLIKRKSSEDGIKRYVLVLVVHHIVADGTSIAILINEFGQLYQRNKLPEIKIQYKDFAHWQNQNMSSDKLKKQEDYWRGVFNDEIPVLNLPTNYKRPSTQTFKGNNYEFSMNEILSNKISEFAIQNNLTLYMVLLSAYNILLSKYSGQEDIVVGCPIAGRHHNGLQNIVGMFVNTLALRNYPQNDMSYFEFVNEVKKTCLDAYQNQDYQFEELVDVLKGKRDPSRNPIFDTMLTLQNMERGELDIQGIKVAAIQFENTTAMFDITIKIFQDGSNFNGVVEYSTDLFDEDYIKCFVEHLKKIMDEILDNPHKLLKDIEIITQSEKDEILNLFNSTNNQFNTMPTIKEIFEAKVLEKPDEIAIIYGDQTLSYKELNIRASQLAHKLNNEGIGRNDIIGVLAERSFEMYISIWAIIKAGAAYLPISPEYPIKRINYLLENSKAKKVLVQNKFIELICNDVEKSYILDINDERNYLDGENLDNKSGADDIVYVIYTSGSTGNPKGVLIENKALINRLAWMQKEYPIGNDDVILQKTTFTFDVSVWEIFWWALEGARMCILPPNDEKDAANIVKCIKEHKVTTMHFVPSMLSLFLGYVEENKLTSELTSIKQVFASGEALNVNQVKKFKQLLYETNNTKLHNLYGPTEATIDVSYYDCIENTIIDTVPIGKPIDNIKLYILDKNGHLQPKGIPGELVISGIGVARGYLNNEELTAEKFVTCNAVGGEKIYKTGDLAKWREDGNIEYLGRADYQIKLRGYRIELGEIERSIQSYSSIKENVVILKYDNNGDGLIIAYIIPDYDKFSQEQDNNINLTFEESQVSDWKSVWNEVYTNQNDDFADRRFNFVTWNSSYTGEILPYEHMDKWLNNTIDNIMALNPLNIVEIGCGLGMILFRVAPRTNKYYATDLSSSAINYVSDIVYSDSELNSKVEVYNLDANQISTLQYINADTIVINSVVQYFPSINHLKSVINQAIDIFGDKAGKIYLGDIRNYMLIDEFYSSVLIFQADETLSIDQLKQKIRNGIDSEAELMINPMFFFALQKNDSRIKGVEILLKKSDDFNEMTLFRYDVVLHITECNNETNIKEIEGIKCQVKEDVEKIILSEKRPIKFVGIPNPNLYEIEHQMLLLDDPSITKVSELKTTCSNEKDTLIQVLNSLKEQIDYKILWNGSKFTYDLLVFDKNENIIVNNNINLVSLSDKIESYSNNPTQSKLTKEIIKSLKDYLKDTIPEYMIPTNFVILENMPLSNNGKIDRKALPEINMTRVKQIGISKPQNETEEIILNIWKGILDIEEISTNDDFFEIGGHSLKVNLMIMNIQKELNVEVPFQEVFNNPTISGLAKYIQTSEKSEFFEIKKVEKQEYYAVSAGQKSMFILQQYATDSINYNLSTVVKILGKVDSNKMKVAFEKLIDRHESLRTNFLFVANELKQVIHDKVELIFEECQINNDQINETIVNFSKPFNLTKDCLIRVLLMHIDENNSILAVDMHHIISDGVSMNVLINEFIQLYCDNKLDDLKLQYKDFVYWQNEYFKSEAYKNQEKFWMDQFKDGVPEFIMPYDYERPDIKKYTGGYLSFTLSKEIADKLEQFGQNNQLTVNMIIYSIYSTLISMYSGNKEVIIGSLVAGRKHIDLQNVIGMFINSLPIKCCIDVNRTFIEVANDVKKNMLEAYENQDVPFEKIVNNLNMITEQNSNSLFNTMLVFHNQTEADENLRMNELEFSRIEYERNAATLDFKLDIMKNPENEFACYIEYSDEMFKAETMIEFIEKFKKFINFVLENPFDKIINYPLFSAKEKRNIKNKINLYLEKEKCRKEDDVYISATFTAEPLKRWLNYWGEEFGKKLNVSFADYNQVFQEILNSKSKLNNTANSVILFRFEDCIRYFEGDEFEKCEKLQQIYKELLHVLNEGTHPFYHFMLLPSQFTEGEVSKYISSLNVKLFDEIDKMDNINAIDLTYHTEDYNGFEIYDLKQDLAGHIPYTDKFFITIATNIYRNIVAQQGHNFKVIVVDCDNTLWKGICGEDGANDVIIEEGYRELQSFLLSKKQEGYLLAISSKNNPNDVEEVFNKNNNMVLSYNDFINTKINWNPKSQSIKEIAQELSLGLDSIIFIDDNPIECMEVLQNAPEVLTLNIPDNPDHIIKFIDHLWATDKLAITMEDRIRNNMYLEEQKRQEEKDEFSTIQDFLINCDIKLDMSLIDEKSAERIAQITQRTNQFNSSTIRRSKEDIINLLHDTNYICWEISVEDKFGKYGIVGVVIAEIHQDHLFIESFLLSCRVLGKHIENAIMFKIKEYCEINSINELKIQYIPSKKNAPVAKYLNEYGWSIEIEEDTVIYRININYIIEENYIKYQKIKERKLTEKPTYNTNISINEENSIRKTNENLCAINLLGEFTLIKEWMYDVYSNKEIKNIKYLKSLIYSNPNIIFDKNNIYKQNTKTQDYFDMENGEGYLEAEGLVKQIWRELLQVEGIESDDSFFDLGGDSLLAIKLEIELTNRGIQIPNFNLYELNTIRKIVNKVLSLKE